METMTIIITRPDPATGNLLSIERQFNYEEIEYYIGGIAMVVENAVEQMREQLDRKEAEIRNHKPQLP